MRAAVARRLLSASHPSVPGERAVLGFRKRNASSVVLATPLDHNNLLWMLGSLCQLYRVPFDARLIVQRFPPPYTLASLCEAAEALGFVLREQARSAQAIDT